MSQFDAGDMPESLHRGRDDLPFIELVEGIETQLVQVDLLTGYRVTRSRFKPGLQVARHLHTGTVTGFTLSGSWHYLEYPEVNRAGSTLFEPAGSIHTLVVPATNEEVTEVIFVSYGANLTLDAQGNIINVDTTARFADIYLAECERRGLPRPRVIGLP